MFKVKKLIFRKVFYCRSIITKEKLLKLFPYSEFIKSKDNKKVLYFKYVHANYDKMASLINKALNDSDRISTVLFPYLESDVSVKGSVVLITSFSIEPKYIKLVKKGKEYSYKFTKQISPSNVLAFIIKDGKEQIPLIKGDND